MYDGVINTNITEVNGVKYSKEDFESYLKVWQYENGDEPVDLDTMYNNFNVYKLYSQYVDKYHIELPSGEQVTAPSETDIAKLSGDYNLSESEYMRVKTEIAKVDHLFANLPEYWIVSDEDYEEHKGENADKFRMFDYRVMQVSVEPAPEVSGDVSGDITNSGDVSGDNGEQARKDAAKSKAVEALAKVQSGDSFEEVAKEYGTSRIVFNGEGYSIINGTLESVAEIYIDQYVWDENVMKALTTLEVGEYSEIYEDESSYTFVYLEGIREGLDEAYDKQYKQSIANEHIQGEALVIPNKFTLKSIDLEDLIPALTKETNESGDTAVEEHDHEHEDESAELSGEVVSNESGEIAE